MMGCVEKDSKEHKKALSSKSKMRMEESSKSKLVLDFLNLGYPQHFQEELLIKLLAMLV